LITGSPRTPVRSSAFRRGLCGNSTAFFVYNYTSMALLTVAAEYQPGERFAAAIKSFASSPPVSAVFIGGGQPLPDALVTLGQKLRSLDAGLLSGAGISRLLEWADTSHLLLLLPGGLVPFPGDRAIERLLGVARNSGAGLVYSDFTDDLSESTEAHPLIDYQPGSIRDNFDFGSMVLVSREAARSALSRHGVIDDAIRWGGLYDLRLKLSIDSAVLRIPEPLYHRSPTDIRDSGKRQFDYVDPSQRDYQLEMERIATSHLRRIGAYLPASFDNPPAAPDHFPVRASVIIPVRNRERTIAQAVRSALSQKTRFDFSVIVVDNHSTDGTTGVVAGFAREHRNVVHLMPERLDLGIGGCWNEAIYSAHCGSIAVQLDSDDLYADDGTLARIVEKFDEGPYAMVIGAYTIVNFDLDEVPPGLIDHREWTRENGRNNALRISGLGAPRAFYVPVLRQFGFPNASYGEDYAVGLRISRHYEIGRIYNSVYFARRWEGNSDARLDTTTANKYEAYKDRLRTIEILARQKKNLE
jgi:hypothetical protein